MTHARTALMAALSMIALSGPPAWGFQQCVEIPWGSGPGHAGQRWETSGSYGPTDFCIVHDGKGSADAALYLLDREQALIQAFALSDGGMIATMAVPPLSERLAVAGDDIAVWDGCRIHLGTWGGAVRVEPHPVYPFRTAGRLLWHDGDLIVADEGEIGFRVTRSQTPLQMEDMTMEPLLPRTVGRNPAGIRIETSTGGIVDVDLPFSAGSTEHLGICGGYHVVVADEILSRSPISARQVIVLVPTGGGQPRLVPIPRMYYSWFPRSMTVTPQAVYCFVSSPQGLHLFRADSSHLADPTLHFPRVPEEPYHFNDHLPRAPGDEPTVDSPRDEGVLSRSQMMENARAYVDLQWTAGAANITDGIELMGDGSYVRTPAWVTVGARRKVPYKWGGFTSIATFSAGVPAGKKCGDDYTDSASWTDLYCIGVDCSGYVSRCWDTDQKYGTSTLHQIATELGSYGELKRGDCLNNAGSHVRLCAEDNPPGMVLTMEASAYDWRVSYRSYTLTALSSYVPMRFDWVVEEEAIAPFVVRVKDGVTSLNVRPGPSTAETPITTVSGGQRFVATAHHNGWYHFHIPSGTGVYGGWSSGGTTSANGYLEGSQSTAVATVTADGLNVREGVGIDYSVITTVSLGQHFAVLASSSGWHQIQLCNTPGYTAGWASGGYLDITAGGPRDGYGATIQTVTYPATLNEGESAWVTVELTNTGQCGWDASTLLATTVPRGRESPFAHDNWVSTATVSSLGAPVLPYQAHTISYQILAPMVASDTAFNEHFGLKQEGFCWFGDPDQRGPADDAVLLGITVHDLGDLAAPAINPASVAIVGGELSFSWAAVAGATSYGVFRGDLAGTPVLAPVAVTAGLSYASSHGVGDIDQNFRYWVRAYAGADSSDLSQPVGECDFALP